MSKRKPRQVVSIRLRPSTIRDLQSLQKLRALDSFSHSIRYVLGIGFANMGNWRRDTPIGTKDVIEGLQFISKP